VEHSGRTGQDIKRNQAGKGHPPTVEHRRRDKSGHQKKPSEGHSLTVERRRGTSRDNERNSGRGTLTLYRTQREIRVRTLKETVTERTHRLPNIKGETSQDTERNQASEEHSPTVKCRGETSQDNEPLASSERVTLTSCRGQKRDKSGHREKQSNQGALTRCRTDGGGGATQHTGINRAREGHSRPVEHRRGTSQNTEETTQSMGTHVLSSTEEGQVRSQKETERARGTHSLSG
jgi:hypothetical protein